MLLDHFPIYYSFELIVSSIRDEIDRKIIRDQLSFLPVRLILEYVVEHWRYTVDIAIAFVLDPNVVD